MIISAGKTIIFTIHQPSYDIFNLFDNLIFLCEGSYVYQVGKN
jgi:ABC-type multidrug transport system ATPase subunit